MSEPEVIRYGVIGYGVEAHPMGKYLSIKEVRAYLEWALDDDSETERRIKDMVDYLA